MMRAHIDMLRVSSKFGDLLSSKAPYIILKQLTEHVRHSTYDLEVTLPYFCYQVHDVRDKDIKMYSASVVESANLFVVWKLKKQ